MNRLIRVGLLAVVGLVGAARAADTPPDGFTPLFNGTDLSGWKPTGMADVWAAENGSTGALHAYDASNLANELYNSNQAGTRDQWGAGNKFITPMIARGKVYVGATNGVAVFGLR